MKNSLSGCHLFGSSQPHVLLLSLALRVAILHPMTWVHEEKAWQPTTTFKHQPKSMSENQVMKCPDNWSKEKKSSTTLRFNLMKLEICIWLEFSCIQHNLNWRCAFGAAVKCQQTSDSLASYFLCIAPKQLSLYWRIYDRSVTPYFAAKCCVKRE